jgi:hypothetical protein
VRDGIFFLLESLQIKDVDVFRFARFQLGRGYRNLAEAQALRRLPESQERDLLIDHLDQKRAVRLENVLRGLATQDRSGRMKIIWRGVSSADPRQRSNSFEALEDSMHRSLSTIMLPLLENLSPQQSLAIGRKAFQLPEFQPGADALCSHFLAKEDWVTVVLTLALIAEQGVTAGLRLPVEGLTTSQNPHIRHLAEVVMGTKRAAATETDNRLESEISVPEKILHLKEIYIFEGLSVSELAAVASVTEEVVYPPGKIVIREGDAGDTMYLVVDGEVSVLKAQGGQDNGNEIELDRIRTGDYFGEMALFEDTLRSATIRTEKETRLLVLDKADLKEIVREYPEIALHICTVLGGRLRKLHEKLQSYEK